VSRATKRAIRRVLIANRGEIAIRIASGARTAGLVPLGVYSEADAHAMHVEAMDDAVCIGPALATESYLVADRILAAARELGADSVHPGYGFLAERAPFADAVRAAGLTFVGPSAEAIAAVGDKSEAKRRARESGVPVVPGYEGEDQSGERLRAEAERIGAPLFVKATAGGGGRGLRVVDDLAHFEEALAAARREALAAFGDATVLLEKHVVRPRHIEFQILADEHGNVVQLGERECSIQRRHQKLIEEAPSVALDAALREKMGAAAVRFARSVGYTNAGTVEFLLDESGSFYFLEMNARLQVEHRVTERVHGVDLVALQFEIASGKRLPFAQSAVAASGWAIEARLNAEDAERGDLPAAGTIERWSVPLLAGVRVDAGVRSGSEVSIYYDSLLAKVVAFGADRSIAAARLSAALEGFDVTGVQTNLPLLRAIARDEAFRAGETTTAFLTERGAAIRAEAAGESAAALLLAVGAVITDPRSWRLAGVGISVRLRGAHRSFAVVATREAEQDGWQLSGDIERDDAAFARTEPEHLVAKVGEQRIAGHVVVTPQLVEVRYDERTFRFTFEVPVASAYSEDAEGRARGTVASPMPGRIVKVEVQAGDGVAERDLLVVLEAMKMEHRIEAPRDGIVKRVTVAPGALVAAGATLVELEA